MREWMHFLFFFFPQVFPPALSDLPPPMLELFDLDESFSSESVRLAQLTNKCKFIISRVDLHRQTVHVQQLLYLRVLHPTARRHRRRPGVLRAEVRRDPGRNSQACQRSAGRQAHLGACLLPGCRVQETQSGENFITLTCENRRRKISPKILFPLAGAQRQIHSTVLRKTTT